jgi:type IV secretion system protein VirB3
MSTGRLQADPLYQGLARPPMIMGVSYMYFTLNGLITLLAFVHSGSFMAYLGGAAIHGFGYLLCMKEPRAVELWMLRMREGYKSWNRAYHHHTNSYDVY